MSRCVPTVFLALVIMGSISLGTRSEEPLAASLLLEAKHPGSDSRWSRSDAEVKRWSVPDGAWIEIQTGVRASWPGAGFAAPEGWWNLGDFAAVEVELKNLGTNSVKVFGRVDNAGADGIRNCVTGDTTLAMGAEAVLRIPLARHAMEKRSGTLFGMRGYPGVPGGDGTLDPSRITQILLFVSKPSESHRFGVRRIRATGEYVKPTASWSDADPFVPFIDGWGQYRHRDWPGKTRDQVDLESKRADEAKDLESRPGPDGWSRFGGWVAGPKLASTGFFRVQKHDGRWWMVDPDGYLFWSHGVDCVRSFDFTAVEDREGWFVDFPGNDSSLAEFWTSGGYALKGHYAGRSPRSFSFAGANLRRKYGETWREVYQGLAHQRLRSWGMNTIANWSAAEVTQLRRTPYTDALESSGAPPIAGSEGYWGKFPDVFDERFEQGLRKGMERKVGRSAGDPWCLGYFSDNEMSWGDEFSLAEAALRSPASQPAKRAFIESLRLRYTTIENLNTAWGTSHASWDALRDQTGVPDRSRAKDDLKAFYSRVAETYFATVRRVIRSVAPNQMYLGCRFAWVNDLAAAAAAKHCDVVSYNIYRRSVADFVFNGGADVPLIIGEFHFGALDRGLFHTGLVPVSSQKARAKAYRDYVEGALRHPQFVGTHWFQWQDEPTTGRVYDEENYQIGLVDVVDTPYPETIEAVRQVGYGMYALRASGTRP